MTRSNTILLIFTAIPFLLSGQFEILSFPTCGEPYSVFGNEKYLPSITSLETTKSLGISHISHVSLTKDPKAGYRIESFSSTEFNDSGRIQAFYSMDSFWQSDSWFFKDRWKVFLTISRVSYSNMSTIDSMSIIILDNHPTKIKDNWVIKTSCQGDSNTESWDDLTNKQFAKVLLNYAYYLPKFSGCEVVLGLVQKDTIGYSRMSPTPYNFNQTDTIHGEALRAWTKPTLIVDNTGALRRKFPMPPDFQNPPPPTNGVISIIYMVRMAGW